MKISIVIPTKNGGNLFKEALEKVCSQDFNEELEIIVIDSGSTDNTMDTASSFKAKVYSIPPEDFNHGLTRNLGIGKSSGEFIILMTQDAVPKNKYWLKTIIGTFNDERIAGVYVKQIPRADADAITKRNLNNWVTGRGEIVIQEIKDLKEFSAMPPVEQFKTCAFDNVCSAIRRKAWEQIPFFESDFGEDIEWSKRVLTAGWKIVYQPEAPVIHSHDRPLTYAFKRAYMCNRKLYQLFKIQMMPTFFSFLKCLPVNIVADSLYVLMNEKGFARKLRLILKLPFLVFADLFGQYMGARDEKRSSGIRMQGV